MTACVWSVRDTSFPASSRTSTCRTIVRLPAWTSSARAVTEPSRTAVRKLVFASIVAVVAPDGS